MDPVTAIGVAAAAVQFFQFALQTLSVCRQIRDSTESSTQRNGELEQALRITTATRKELQAQPKKSAPRRISDIAKECVTLSEELTKLLEDVRGANRNTGKAKAMFRALRDQRKIEKLENKLKAKQTLLDQALLQDTWIQSQLLVVEQSKGFEQLDKKIQSLVNDLLSRDKQLTDRLNKLDLNNETGIRSLDKSISSKLAISDRQSQARFTQAESSSQARHDELMSARRRERFLDSLFFEEIHARRRNITDAAPDTVNYIFRSPGDATEERWDSFVEWLRDPSSGIYWIRGKAGSGKSTLMAHIVGDDRTKEYLKFGCGGREIVLLSFYFWLPGSELQKSTVGLLRSLLFQICQARPSLIDIVLDSLTISGDRLETWTQNRLRDAISTVLGAVDDLFVAVFIDALDEYHGDYNAVIDLIVPLENFPGIKCCVSSRPEIQFVKKLGSCKQLLLENLNFGSIKTFLGSRLAAVHLQHNWKNRLEKVIALRAQGVFLWAALVVQGLIRGIESGDDDLCTMFKWIDALPGELHELFSNMLEKVHRIHRPNFALYVSTVARPYWVSAEVPISIALITAARMLDTLEQRPFSDGHFAKLCAQTETQIYAQCAGLLIVERDGHLGSVAELFFKSLRSHEAFENPGMSKSDSTIYSRVYVSRSSAYDFEMYESRITEWVHRSAHDFMFGEDSHKPIDSWLPSTESLLTRLYNASLWLISEAPSMIGDLPRLNTGTRTRNLVLLMLSQYDSFPGPALAALTRLKGIILRMNPREFNMNEESDGQYGAEATKHLPLIRLMRYAMDTMMTYNVDPVDICKVLMDTGTGDLLITNFRLTEVYRRGYEPLNSWNAISEPESAILDSIHCALSRLSSRCVVPADQNCTKSFVTFRIPHEIEQIYRICSSTRRQTISIHCRTTSLDILTSNEILIAAFILLGEETRNRRLLLSIDRSLAQQFFINTGMYTGAGLESVHLSIQFPPVLRGLPNVEVLNVRPERIPAPTSLRILCLPRRILRENTFVGFDRAKVSLNKFNYQIFHDAIHIKPSPETQRTILRMIANILDDTERDPGSKVKHCRDMLVKEIWENEQGLSSSEQLIALACVKVDFEKVFDRYSISNLLRNFQESG